MKTINKLLRVFGVKLIPTLTYFEFCGKFYRFPLRVEEKGNRSVIVDATGKELHVYLAHEEGRNFFLRVLNEFQDKRNHKKRGFTIKRKIDISEEDEFIKETFKNLDDDITFLKVFVYGIFLIVLVALIAYLVGTYLM